MITTNPLLITLKAVQLLVLGVIMVGYSDHAQEPVVCTQETCILLRHTWMIWKIKIV